MMMFATVAVLSALCMATVRGECAATRERALKAGLMAESLEVTSSFPVHLSNDPDATTLRLELRASNVEDLDAFEQRLTVTQDTTANSLHIEVDRKTLYNNFCTPVGRVGCECSGATCDAGLTCKSGVCAVTSGACTAGDGGCECAEGTRCFTPFECIANQCVKTIVAPLPQSTPASALRFDCWSPLAALAASFAARPVAAESLCTAGGDIGSIALIFPGAEKGKVNVVPDATAAPTPAPVGEPTTTVAGGGNSTPKPSPVSAATPKPAAVVPDGSIHVPKPRASLMVGFWHADETRAADTTLQANDAASLGVAWNAALARPHSECVVIEYTGATLATFTSIYTGDADFASAGGQLVLRAANEVLVTDKMTLRGVSGLFLSGPWNFVRKSVIGANQSYNLFIYPPNNKENQVIGVTIVGARGGVPDSEVASTSYQQYTSWMATLAIVDLVIKNCEIRNFMEAVEMGKGGRLVAIDNFFSGHVDDIFFVNMRRATVAATTYTYAANNVVGPGLNHKDTHGLHPDFVQHTAPGEPQGSKYVDDIYANIYFNNGNHDGYMWQFFWPGEGEQPQPIDRDVKGFNNIITAGHRGISVQSAKEEWRYNIITIVPGDRPQGNGNIAPSVMANRNFIGKGSDAIVANNILARATAVHLDTDKSLVTTGTIVANPALTDRNNPAHMTKVFGNTDGDDSKGHFVETSPAHLLAGKSTLTRAAVLEWIATHREPTSAGGWSTTGTVGTAFVDPRLITTKAIFD